MKIYLCDYCGKIVWSLFVIRIDGKDTSLCDKCYRELVLKDKFEVQTVA